MEEWSKAPEKTYFDPHSQRFDYSKRQKNLHKIVQFFIQCLFLSILTQKFPNFQALTHSHDEEDPNPAVDDEKIEKLVDSVLKNIDQNNDGFIDYMEYVRSQEGDK